MKNKIKTNLGEDIYEKFENYIAFDKMSFVQVDQSKLSLPDYIFAGLNFPLKINISPESLDLFSYKPLLIDQLSIKKGKISGDYDMLTPQGEYKTFNLSGKVAYKAIGYFVFLNSEIKRSNVYFYGSNFNPIIPNKEKNTAQFTPDVNNERKSYIPVVDDNYLSYLQLFKKYLKANYKTAKSKAEEKGENPVGREFDLCKDNSISGKKILISKLYSNDEWDDNYFSSTVIPSLTQKGFQIDLINDLNTVVDKLNNDDSYTSFWYISFCNSFTLPDDFEVIVKNFQQKKPIFLFADASPCFFCIDNILKQIVGLSTFTGNYAGKQFLWAGNGQVRGTFNKTHPLARGFVKFYEGNSLSTLENYSTAFDSFAMHNDPGNVPVILYNKSSIEGGRILVDSSFSKMYKSNFNDDTARYLTNAACWLHHFENDPDIIN